MWYNVKGVEACGCTLKRGAAMRECNIAKNKKILAIKALRTETGLGLKECKAAVDSLKNWPIVDAPNN